MAGSQVNEEEVMAKLRERLNQFYLTKPESTTTNAAGTETADPNSNNNNEPPPFSPQPHAQEFLSLEAFPDTPPEFSADTETTSDTDCEVDPDMHRSRFVDPPRAPGGYGPQDARSNLAVQPAASPAKISLKKASVKVVGPAGRTKPAPSSRATPATEPICSTPTVQDKHKSAEPTASSAAPSIPQVKLVTAPSKTASDAEAEIDEMYARLTSTSSAGHASPAAVHGQGPTGVSTSMFSLEETSAPKTPTPTIKTVTNSAPKEVRMAKNPTMASDVPISAQARHPEAAKQSSTTGVEPGNAGHRWDGMSKEQLECEYFKKATKYVTSFSGKVKTPVTESIKNVVVELRSWFTVNAQEKSAAAVDLKIKLSEAIVAYLQGLSKRGAKPVTPVFVHNALEENSGDFLRLCAALADKKLLVIDNLQELIGLCKAISDAVPKEEAKPDDSAKPGDTKQAFQDPMDKMTAGPFQEKRENVAGCRTCILKGVSGIASINQLQALVWGGRLESLSLPEKGSEVALVKFLTPEACQKYFDETKNGIEVSGDKKAVVVVEKQPGPNSINDVIRNCIEGDATRCVRVWDADKDWSDMVLLKLARGKGTVKREIDRIKRGKDAKGRFYIEFRFANILHALNFKRFLLDDEEWEPCTIAYGPDPCETACGAHFEDEDEEPSTGSGFFT